MAPANKKIGKAIFLLLKFAVSSVLLVFLFSRAGGAAVIRNMVLVSPAYFAAAVALYLFSTYLSSLRWKLLIPYPLGTRQVFSMNIVGAFFNVCLPGTMGGDAVKAYYLSRELKRHTTDSDKGSLSSRHNVIALTSIFMDRYWGFTALMAIALAAFPAGYGLLRNTPAVWAVPFMVAGFAAASVLLFRFRFGERIKFLVGVYDYFKYYLAKRRVILKALLYSVVIQILTFVSVYVIASGMGLDIPFVSLMVFLPLIITITLIPVSISGIGLREGAFVFFLGTMGVPPDKAMTLSMLWFLSVVVAGLWGLVEYLRFKQLFGGGIK